MTEARYRQWTQRWAVFSGVVVLASLAVSPIVAWDKLIDDDAGVLVRDIVIAPLGGLVAYFAVRWALASARRIAYRFFLPQQKARQIVRDAVARGWLPEGSTHSHAQERKIARTIRYDLKLGLSDSDIRRDLEDLI